MTRTRKQGRRKADRRVHARALNLLETRWDKHAIIAYRHPRPFPVPFKKELPGLWSAVESDPRLCVSLVELAMRDSAQVHEARTWTRFRLRGHRNRRQLLRRILRLVEDGRVTGFLAGLLDDAFDRLDPEGKLPRQPRRGERLLKSLQRVVQEWADGNRSIEPRIMAEAALEAAELGSISRARNLKPEWFFATEAWLRLIVRHGWSEHAATRDLYALLVRGRFREPDPLEGDAPAAIFPGISREDFRRRLYMVRARLLRLPPLSARRRDRLIEALDLRDKR